MGAAAAMTLRQAISDAFHPVPAAAARALWSCGEAEFVAAARPGPDWWGRRPGGFFGPAYEAIAARFPGPGGTTEAARTAREVATVLRVARAHFGARADARRLRILDVPCGAGRHARALATQGFAVVGLDLQEHALRRLRPVPCAVADMRSLPVASGSFDLVLNLWNSLGYFLEEAEDLVPLGEFRRVLRPGGLAVLQADLDARAVAEGRWSQHMKVPLGEGVLFLVRQVPVAALGGLACLCWVVFPGEEPWQGPPWFLRLRDDAAWRRLGAAAGFREVAIERGAPGAPAEETILRLVA
jgi:SAM-dependent methyltransferase